MCERTIKMSKYVGMICPACNDEILDGDYLVICKNCGRPYHHDCWERSGGCISSSCLEMQSNESDVQTTKTCTKCQATLHSDQDYCHKCGQKNTQGSYDSKKYNRAGRSTKKKGSKVWVAGLFALILILATIAVLSGVFTTTSFAKLFPEYKLKLWCTIADDGSYMEIDTNRYDIDDHFDAEAYSAIVKINEKLGFNEALGKKMEQTRSLDGRQMDSNKKYTVSWTYHPNRGLEVIYEKKK